MVPIIPPLPGEVLSQIKLMFSTNGLTVFELTYFICYTYFYFTKDHVNCNKHKPVAYNNHRIWYNSTILIIEIEIEKSVLLLDFWVYFLNWLRILRLEAMKCSSWKMSRWKHGLANLNAQCCLLEAKNTVPIKFCTKTRWCGILILWLQTPLSVTILRTIYNG